MERRETFETIAESYDRFRPSYPREAFAEIDAAVGTTSRRRALEIGPGTGQATRLLVALGFRTTCLEPGQRLATILARNLRDATSVVIRNTSLENWELEPAAFDLVLAAQSFHHAVRKTRVQRAAAALVPGGVLALMWNRSIPASTPVWLAVDAVYSRCAPALKSRAGDGDGPVSEIDASGRFQQVREHRYAWEQAYSGSDYASLAATHSEHVLLPEPGRQALLVALRSAIEEHGDRIVVKRETVLYLARRRSD